MAPRLRDFAARLGGLSAWAFAALLGYVALRGDRSVFEGFSWLRLALCGLFITGCALYWAWLHGPARAAEAQSLRAALAPGWPLCLAALLAAPISTDSQLYLHYGAMALSGVNPYLEPSGAMQSVFSPLVQWNQTCVYGPLALGLFALAAVFQSPLLGVACLKLAWLGAQLAGAGAVWAAGGEERTWRTRAFAFNPVLLLAFVVDVHVDALTCALLLWSFVALARERALLALGLLCAAILTKSVALLALPLWFAWALARRRVALAAAGVGLLLALVGVLALTLFPTALAFRSLANPIANTGRSIQHVLVLSGQLLGFDGARAAAAYSFMARCIYLLVATAVWLRALRGRGGNARGSAREQNYDAPALAHDFALLLLLACLYVVPFVPWWYSALIVAAALWIPGVGWLWPAAQTFGVCATLTLSAGSGLSKAGLVSSVLAIAPTTAVLLRSVRRRQG